MVVVWQNREVHVSVLQSNNENSPSFCFLAVHAPSIINDVKKDTTVS